MHIFLPLHVQNSIVFAQHVLFVITTLLNAIALFCLLKQTPPNQAGIRKYLILIQISLVVVDVFIDILTTPIPLFPALGGYCVGLLCQAGLSAKAVMGGICLMLTNIAVAILFCVIFKQQNLLLPSSRFKLSNGFLNFIRITFFVLFSTPPLFFIAMPSRAEEIAWLIETSPYKVSWILERGSCHFERRSTIIVCLGYAGVMIFLSFAVVIALLFLHMFCVINARLITFLISLCGTAHRTGKREANSSTNSRNLRKSIIILFAQLVIPLTVMVFPAIVIFTSIATESFSFETCLVAYYTITFHSLVHNTLLLAVTPAYRRFLAAALKCQFTSAWRNSSERNASMVSEIQRRKSRVSPLD